MLDKELVAPVMKWVGGKRQLLSRITPLIPKHFDTYCKPFVGGGAVLFALQPAEAIVNDLNADLITVYRVIREHVQELICSLERLPMVFYFICLWVSSSVENRGKSFGKIKTKLPRKALRDAASSDFPHYLLVGMLICGKGGRGRGSVGKPRPENAKASRLCGGFASKGIRF